jgi:multidrug resistance protein
MEVVSNDPLAEQKTSVSKMSTVEGDENSTEVQNITQEASQDRFAKREKLSPALSQNKGSGESEITDFSDAYQSTLVDPSESVLGTSTEKERDPEIVYHREGIERAAGGWDGPKDPANPMNWPKWKRLGHVTMVATIVFIVSVYYNYDFEGPALICRRNLSTTISAPASGVIMKEFDQDNAIIGTFTVSIFLLGFTLGPLVMAPLSEIYGRLIVYHLSIATFVVFLLGCGSSQSIVSFLILRFIAGCAASSPSTIGGGTVADLIPVQERGGAMAMTALGPILAPVIGPVIGGFITQNLSWRWTFWIVGIAVCIPHVSEY